MIAQSDIDVLKAAMPDVLRYYGVTNLGRNFSSLWREDRDPSCRFYADTNLVTDYGEGVTVDVFGLVGKVEGVPGFADQVRVVSQIVGHVLDESAVAYEPANKIERPPFEPPARAGWPDEPMAMYAHLMGDGCLSSEPAKSYLHGRGFCNHDIYENVLGYVPSGECIVRDDGTKLFTLYEPNTPRGYIVIPFPLDSTFCRVHYAMLRAIPGDKPPEHKELRPTGYSSPLYREYMLSEGLPVLYIVEGLLDCLAFEKLTARPVMALGGAGLKRRVGQVLYYTPAELRPKKIVLALDADEAGRKASAKIARDLDYIGIPHGVFPMPGGCKDPNDILVRIGGEK